MPKITEQGLAIPVYLPLSFPEVPGASERSKRREKASYFLERKNRVEALHEFIKICFKPLAESPKTGTSCAISYVKNLKTHIILHSTLVKIADNRYVRSIKRKSHTVFPCRRLFFNESHFPELTRGRTRTVVET